MQCTRVGAMLLEADLINDEQLNEALTYQQNRGGKTLGILIELGAIEHDDVYKFLSKRGMPAISPTHCNVSQHIIDLLPRDFALQHEMIPVDRLGRLLTVAMVYPFDTDAISKAEAITGLRVKPVLCRSKEFRESARRYYPGDYEFISGNGNPMGSRNGSGASIVPPKNDRLAQQTLARIRDLYELPVTKHTKGRMGMLEESRGLNVDRAAAILSRDPVGLARVLAAANTREWTRRRPILDRHDAIRILGLNGVVEALESLSAWEDRLRHVEPIFTKWRETSVAVAETAATIAKSYAFAGAAGVYEAALLHNIGSLALLMLDTDNYPAIFTAKPGALKRQHELDLFGITGSEAGAELAKAWGLPESIVLTIRHLYMPESAPSSHDTIAVTALAHHIVQTEQSLENDCEEALRILGLTSASLRTTIVRLHANRHADAVEI